MANYLTGAARFKDGELEELAVYPTDPDPELEALGHMQMDYIATATSVIEGIKAGDKYFASFHGTDAMFSVEIVTREGGETLEVANVGQPAQFASLKNLPEPGG